MNCVEFQDLIPKERTEFIGQLVHACTSDSKLFQMGERIIKQAIRKGLFDGVVINPIAEVNNISESNNINS